MRQNMTDNKSNAKKRIITPHKGDRSERLFCRIRPDVKEMLENQAKAAGVSTADLIEKWTLENNKK